MDVTCYLLLGIEAGIQLITVDSHLQGWGANMHAVQCIPRGLPLNTVLFVSKCYPLPSPVVSGCGFATNVGRVQQRFRSNEGLYKQKRVIMF